MRRSGTRPVASRIRSFGSEHLWVMAVAASPDAGLVATGGYDMLARLWRCCPPEPKSLLEGHGSVVDDVAFSLGTAGRDGVAGPHRDGLVDVRRPASAEDRPD